MIVCQDCDKVFTKEKYLLFHKKHCKGRLYCKNPECNNRLIGRWQKKFCSSSCNTKISNKDRKHSIKTRQKISKSLGGKGKEKSIKECLICKKETTNNKCCSIQCSGIYQHQKAVNKWLENPRKFSDSRLFMKKYLIDKYGEKCSKCGWKEKNTYTRKIPLELHHKDGRHYNNNLENLEILCPNCHSLTEFFKAKNVGNGRKNRNNK